MSATDDVLTANAAYASRRDAALGSLAAPPSSRLAVVTCMDARLDPLAGLGLELGQAHVIRNAGGLVTDDVLRSLAISQRALDTAEIAVLHHTKCGMQGFDDAAFRAQLSDEAGVEPAWRVDGFADVSDQVRRSLAAVRDCPWLPRRDAVRGFVWDVTSGAIEEIA